MIDPGYMAAILAWHWQPIALALSVLLTCVHAAEEALGDGSPLWEYLGRHSGARIAPALGIVLVLVLTPAWCIGLAALAYGWPSPCWAVALAGARIYDSACTHWLPALCDRRPNPGLPTTALYAAEAVAILAAMLPSASPPGPIWLLLGGLPFLALWPALALLRRLQSP